MGTKKGLPIMKKQNKFSPVEIKYLRKDGHNHRCLYLCRCGKKFEALRSNVNSGNTKSCGCHRVATSTQKAFKHGLSGKGTYWVWGNMMARCFNPNNRAYHNYGGRGITVSKDWTEYANFNRDMGARPHGLTLERKNNSLGYSKSNCVWASRKEQQRNYRGNRMIEIDGVTKTAVDWAEFAGIPRDRIMGRLRMGWTGKRLLDKGTWNRPYEK